MRTLQSLEPTLQGVPAEHSEVQVPEQWRTSKMITKLSIVALLPLSTPTRYTVRELCIRDVESGRIFNGANREMDI